MNANLYRVGGTVCEAPEHCCDCGQPATQFEGRRAVNPANNEVVGRCDSCADLYRRRREWAARNPRLEDERFHLECEAGYTGDFAAVDEFDRRHRYPHA